MSKLFLLTAVCICGLELVSAGCYGLFGKSNEQKLNCHLKQMKLEGDADRLMDETVDWYAKEFGAGKVKDPELAQFLADVIGLKEASLECSDENIDKAGRVAKRTSANLLEIERNKDPAKLMIAELLARFSARCEKRLTEPLLAKLRQVSARTLNHLGRFVQSYAAHTSAYESVMRNPRLSLPTSAQFRRDMEIPYDSREEFGGQIFLNFLEIASAENELVTEESVRSDPAAARTLYKKYFLDACADYLEKVPARTFEDFHDYLERFGQPGKSQSGGFRLLTTSWIDHEVCQRVVAGKAYEDILLSLQPYLRN